MNIEVQLLHKTPIEVLVGAIRQCYESQDKSDSMYFEGEYQLGERDSKLISNIIQNGHTSTLEHITFNFQIKGISRLNLQELARHRMASLSVKSTRYTLKELKNEASFIPDAMLYNWERASKYINFIELETPDNIHYFSKNEIDKTSIRALENLRRLVASGEFTNDQAKYALPECYRLDLYWSINARSLQNFLTLRTSEKAHFEIREMAWKIYYAIPEEYKFLFKV